MQKIQISEIQGKKIIAFMLLFFVLVSPISFAVETTVVTSSNQLTQNTVTSSSSYYDLSLNAGSYYSPTTTSLLGDQDLGEAIVVNVMNVEPSAPIKSRFIENSNVPVYIYLGGSTFGSTLFGAEGPQSEPFISQPKIKNAYILIDPASRKYIVGSPYYVRPTSYNLDMNNLGYAVILLKKIEKEDDVPEEIILNMSMKIFFDFARGFGDVSATDLVLKEMSNENNWKAPDPTDPIKQSESDRNTFWNGKASLRLIDVSNSRARIQVYGNGMMPILSSTGDEFLERGIITLSVGESKVVTLPGTSAFFQDKVRIQLNKIGDPKSIANVRVVSGGSVLNRKLFEGEKIFPGSDWSVKKISKVLINDNTDNETVIFVNSFGDTQTINRLSSKSSSTEKKIIVTDQNLNEIEKQVCSSEFIINDYFNEYNIVNNIIKSDVNEIINLDNNIEKLSNEISGMVVGTTLSEEVSGESEGARRLYCTAVNEYKKALTGDDKTIYGKIAKAYGNEGLARFYVSRPGGVLDLESANMRDLILGLSSYYDLKAGNTDEAERTNNIIFEKSESNVLWIAEEDLKLSLDGVEIIGNQEKTRVEISVNNGASENKIIRDTIGAPWIDTTNKQQVTLRIIDIEDNYVTVNEERTGSISQTRRLEEGQIYKYGINSEQSFTVGRIYSNKRVYVSVYPGSGNVFSQSTFNVHIPIEKRPDFMSLTDEEIDNLIDKNNQIIEKLDHNIEQLDNLIKVWNNVCLFTWTYLMIKNSFLGKSTERNEARRDIMPVYNQYCEENSAYNKKYKTFDDCMNELSKDIENNLDIAQTTIKNSKVCEKAVDFTDKFDKCSIQESDGFVTESKLSTFDKLKENAGLTPTISDGTFSDYYKFCVEYDKMFPDEGQFKAYRSILTKKCSDANSTIKRETDAANNALNALNKVSIKEEGESYSYYLTNKNEFDKLPYTQQQKVLEEYNFLRSYNSEKNTKGEIDSAKNKELISKARQEYGIDENHVLVRVLSESDTKYKGLDSGLNYLSLVIPTYRDIKSTSLYQSKIKKCEGLDQKEKCISTIEDSKVTFENGISIYKKEGTSELYLSLGEFTYAPTGERFDYAGDAKLEIDNKGRPYCIPIGNGNYYWIQGEDDAWNARGEPISGFVSLMNVGYDGKLCSGPDDVQIKDPVNIGKDINEMNKVKQLVKGIKCDDGTFVSVSGKKWQCSKESFNTDQSGEATHCQDVMDPSDCKTLFLVCDPVMCPASRFNFGGEYNTQGESIVQKGIIGSLILGQKNFNHPVCLPGIMAGLKNIKSVVQGFNECLIASKTEGKNIGICDDIKSIGICEILWREAINLFKLRGSLSSLITKTVYGRGETSGGGEYLQNLNQKLKDMSASVKYFTDQYSTSTFTAFKGKSTEEVGGEVCKAAVYGKFADVGDFISQVSEPENPPQATAWFSESPWSKQGGITYDQYGKPSTQEQSEYSIYYHIYAGTVPDFAQVGYAQEGVRYAVYLTNMDETQSLYVTTNNPNQYYGTIPYDGYADQSVVVYGPANLEKICIWLNGQKVCGVGKASTLFALNGINDLYVADEAARTDIKTMEECVPEYETTSPSLGSLTTPRNYGALSTGIIRMCSVRDPNEDETKNKQRWRVVGTCGKDEQEHNLGSCWLDTDSISINNVKTLAEVNNQITLNEQDILTAQNKIDITKIKFFNEENSATYFGKLESYNIEEIDATTLLNLLAGSLVSGSDSNGNDIQINYRDLSIYSEDESIRLQAQVKIGDIYIKLAEKIASPNYNVYTSSAGTQQNIVVGDETTKVETTNTKSKCSECGGKVLDTNICKEDECKSLGNCFFLKGLTGFIELIYPTGNKCQDCPSDCNNLFEENYCNQCNACKWLMSQNKCVSESDYLIESNEIDIQKEISDLNKEVEVYLKQIQKTQEPQIAYFKSKQELTIYETIQAYYKLNPISTDSSEIKQVKTLYEQIYNNNRFQDELSGQSYGAISSEGKIISGACVKLEFNSNQLKLITDLNKTKILIASPLYKNPSCSELLFPSLSQPSIYSQQ